MKYLFSQKQLLETLDDPALYKEAGIGDFVTKIKNFLKGDPDSPTLKERALKVVDKLHSYIHDHLDSEEARRMRNIENSISDYFNLGDQQNAVQTIQVDNMDQDTFIDHVVENTSLERTQILQIIVETGNKYIKPMVEDIVKEDISTNALLTKENLRAMKNSCYDKIVHNNTELKEHIVTNVCKQCSTTNMKYVCSPDSDLGDDLYESYCSIGYKYIKQIITDLYNSIAPSGKADELQFSNREKRRIDDFNNLYSSPEGTKKAEELPTLNDAKQVQDNIYDTTAFSIKEYDSIPIVYLTEDHIYKNAGELKNLMAQSTEPIPYAIGRLTNDNCLFLTAYHNNFRDTVVQDAEFKLDIEKNSQVRLEKIYKFQTQRNTSVLEKRLASLM